MNTLGKVFLGIGAFAAGVAVGLMIAPKSGKELRSEIREKVKNLPEDFADIDMSHVSADISRHDLEEQLMK